MKDAIGKELSVGDEIVYVDGNGRGSSLNPAIVDGFTPKMVKILTVHEGSYMSVKVDGKYIRVGPVKPFYPATVTPAKVIKVKHSGE